MWYNIGVMAEENKEKLIEAEEVRQRVDGLKRKVAEMADYIRVDARRQQLAALEAQQAAADAQSQRDALMKQILSFFSR